MLNSFDFRGLDRLPFVSIVGLSVGLTMCIIAMTMIWKSSDRSTAQMQHRGALALLATGVISIWCSSNWGMASLTELETSTVNSWFIATTLIPVAAGMTMTYISLKTGRLIATLVSIWCSFGAFALSSAAISAYYLTAGRLTPLTWSFISFMSQWAVILVGTSIIVMMLVRATNSFGSKKYDEGTRDTAGVASGIAVKR